MDTLPFVSVIIPTYNRGEYLRKTLDSFIAQKYPSDKYEIIISNNNSKDGTEDIISEYLSKYKNIKSLFEIRQGVHYARNSAAKTAKGEILYFTDDDMIADPMMLEELVKVFEIDPLIGCAAGKIIPKFLSPPPKWVRKYLINSLLSLTKEDQIQELIVSGDDINLVFSCHQAVKREVFMKAGGFNPENSAGVWMGDGESGLNLKIIALGFSLAYTAKSICYHIIPPERMTLTYLIKRIGNEAYCNSYMDYREYRKKELIIPKLIKRNILDSINLLSRTLIKIILGRSSWRFLPAYIVYLHNRNRYDLKLLFDKKFRRIVEIDDWLNEDNRDYQLTSLL
jgi:glucosyl-dolichyl phosphate glucuronosyltransferase